MGIYYPPVGFHFKVEIDGISKGEDDDVRFQEVSGLSVELTTEDLKEGGENRFTHKLPVKASHNNLILKRGLLKNSKLIDWCNDAIENFNFAPHDMLVTLLNENHEPLLSWSIINAWPVKWSISDFNATNSAIVVETIELNYNYFRRTIP
jgi:phage tail-like protein